MSRLSVPRLVLYLALAAPAALPGVAQPVAQATDPFGGLLPVGPAAANRSQLLVGPAGLPLTAPSSLSPEAVAHRFLEEHVAASGDWSLESTLEGGGDVLFFRFRQSFQEIPVLLGTVEVAVGPEGSVRAARLGEIAMGGPVQGNPIRIAGREQAVAQVRAALGWPQTSGARIRESATRVLLPTPRGAEVAWRVDLHHPLQRETQVRALVREADGDLLGAVPRAFHAVSGGRVFPEDPSQGSVLLPFPDGEGNLSVHSPAGWTYVDDVSLGNNIAAELDREADFLDTPGQRAQAVGVPAVFDFPFTGDPQVDVDAALANVFWALNDAHDRFRALGLREENGAFQDDNFGRGGVEGDRVVALVQYDSGDGSRPINDLYSGTSVDGSFSWIAVGLFETPEGEIRDAAFETDLLYHEYGHLAVTRLLGDALCLDGNQASAMAEGTGDFFGASFTEDPVIGAWVANEPSAGLRRNALDRSNFTYFNLCFDGCNAVRDGEIWSATLWDLREELVAMYGPEEGARRAEMLVLEGLRYTACRPSFPQARDGILAADTALFGGAHRCLIWRVFSFRGIGYSAVSNGSNDPEPDPAVDMAPECLAGGAVRWEAAEYGTDADAAVEVFDRNRAGDEIQVLVTSGSGDQETYTARRVQIGTAVFRTIVPLETGAVQLADGRLQVADGDTLDATVQDLGVSAQVGVSQGFPLIVASHVTYGNCQEGGVEDDRPAGFYNLPGFLDAGEQADITVILGHGALTALEDASVQVTSRNPDVVVLPSGPIELGTLTAAPSVGVARGFQVVVRAQAASTVQTGDTADLVFDLTARGRRAQATLRLDLNRDYEIIQDFSPFAGGVETFETDSPTVSAWTHQACRGREDFWSLGSCAGVGGSAGFQNGLGSCDPYVWGQEASYLLSPPLFPLPADSEAIQLREYRWEHSVNLYTHPVDRYCDADLVALYLTQDPASLPCADGTRVFEYGPQRVYLFTDNTDGYAPGGPYSVNTGPVVLDPNTDYGSMRLAWVFFGDIFDCYQDNVNQGWYRLDNFRFTYDLVVSVPERSPCSLDCALRTEAVPSPSAGHCDGEAFEIDASATEAVGCPSAIRYAFAGPGVPPAYGWTYESVAPAMGEPGGVYSVYAQCEDIADCNHYAQFTNEDPAAPGLGGAIAGSLRVSRSGGETVAAFLGAAAPDTFGIYGIDGPARLGEPTGSWDHFGSGRASGPGGEGEVRFDVQANSPEGILYFKVLPRDPCTDTPRD